MQHMIIGVLLVLILPETEQRCIYPRILEAAENWVHVHAAITGSGGGRWGLTRNQTHAAKHAAHHPYS